MSLWYITFNMLPSSSARTTPHNTANKPSHPYSTPTCAAVPPVLYRHHHRPTPRHSHCVFTLTPPCQVPSPIKEARSKTRDSLDIFRHKRNKDHHNGYREKEKNVTICTEEEEEATTMWGNWSYTTPVSYLTHLANEFMDKDKSPSPNSSSIPRHHDCSRIAVQQGHHHHHHHHHSPSASSSQRNRSRLDNKREDVNNWPLRLTTSEKSAKGRQGVGLGMDGSRMAQEVEVGSNDESITHEYLKVFEDHEDDQDEEGYEEAGYDENKVVVPEPESPEEWEWDRLLEQMEKNDEKEKKR